ncbi:MAG: hypothetical protein HQL98_14250 [Magnetococcales bacterium]|nr:hypothetical protein [Magnetococcales bacterium]
MFLLRLLLLLATAYLFYRLVRSLLPRPRSQELPRGGSATPLVRCAQCATLIPPDSAITRGERLFCSETCRIASSR